MVLVQHIRIVINERFHHIIIIHDFCDIANNYNDNNDWNNSNEMNMV